MQDWKMCKEKGVKPFIELLVEKYLGDFVSQEYTMTMVPTDEVKEEDDNEQGDEEVFEKKVVPEY